MGALKTTATVGGGALCGGGGTLGVGYGIHEGTKSTIEDVLGEDLLDTENNSEEWKALEGKLNTHKANAGFGLKELTLGNPVAGNVLNNWCKDRKSDSAKSLLYSNGSFISTVKLYCVYKIREKLQDSTNKASIEILSVDNDNDKEQFKTGISNLKSLSDSDSGNGKVDDTTPVLKKLKENSNGNDESKANELKQWCKKAIDRGYKNQNQNLYKLAKHLCTKNKASR